MCTITSLFIERDKVHYLFKFCALLLLSYVTLRYRVGADWDHYSGIYDMADWDSVFGNNNAEPLFMLLCICFKSMHFDFYILSAFLGVITCILFFKLISDYSEYPMLSLTFMVVPFIYIGVTMIRQGLSLALVLFAFRYISSRNYFAYFSILLVAIGFHYSAAITVVFFFLNRAFSTNKLVVSALIVFIVCIIQIKFDFSYLTVLERISFGHVQHKIQAYLVDSNYVYITLKSVLWRLFVLCLAWYNYSKDKSQNSILFFNIYFFGLAVYLLNGAAPVIASRGAFYCKIFEWFILSKLVKDFIFAKKYPLVIISLLICFTYYGRQLYYFNINHMDQYYVYKSYIPWVQTMLDRVSNF